MIAPTVEIGRRTREMAKELEMSDLVSISVGFHLDGVNIARRLVAEGTEVLVSRRSTSVLIEEALDVPNVGLPVTLEDLALALSQAREVTGLAHPQVGIFVMPDVQSDVEAFAKHLAFDLRIYPVTPDEEYLSRMVDRAIADKMDVIIAGTVATVFANERGIASVFMDSGPVSLRIALKEARRVAYGRKLEQARAEDFRIVVNTSYNGVLLLDRDLGVVVANPSARRILNLPAIEQGGNIADILPELDLSPCFEGEHIHNLFLETKRGALVLDATPTKVDNAMRGVVVSFQLAESVTELGANTRNNLFSQGFSSKYTFSSIVGESDSILAAKAKARGYAAGTGSVLLVGETGTGKELFAHAVHHASSASRGPFVPVNCAAIPSSLLESELFGYEEGAFTGAIRKGKPGLFELAHQGTIFLDEISELSKQAQLRLLRVLQEKSILRLGGSKLIPVDVRIIAATNKNLRTLVEDGKFRNDLFYRLSVLPLFIPPLRHREGDVALLAHYFARQMSLQSRAPVQLKKAHLRQLEAHAWPGNVRELQSVVERFSVACNAGLEPDIAAMITPDMEWDSLGDEPRGLTLTLTPDQQSERNRITRALQQCNGRRGDAAKTLGMNRTTLFRKMSRYGMA